MLDKLFLGAILSFEIRKGSIIMEDIPEWAIQVSCEMLGYTDISEVPVDKIEDIYSMAFNII